MSEYIAKANILFDGAVYFTGETLHLTDTDASRIKRYIEPINKKTEQPQPQPTKVDYNELTTSELKKLVEERNLDVVATGKNGSPIKADYVKALEQSDEQD